MKNKLIDVTLQIPKLLMHNEQLADPLNDYTRALKAVTGKRKKTEADHLEMSRIEFQGGLYHDDRLGPYVPAKWLITMIIEGARKQRLGKDAEAYVQVVEEIHPLKYNGPRDREELWENRKRFMDRRCVGNQANRVMRTRPRFENCSVDFTLRVLEGGPDVDSIEQALETASIACGIGDGRPRFAGTFIVKKFDVQDDRD